MKEWANDEEEGKDVDSTSPSFVPPPHHQLLREIYLRESFCWTTFGTPPPPHVLSHSSLENLGSSR